MPLKFSCKSGAFASGSVKFGHRYGSTGNKQTTSKPRNEVKCYKCKKFGHFRNKCANAEMQEKGKGPEKAGTNAFNAVFLSCCLIIVTGMVIPELVFI